MLNDLLKEIGATPFSLIIDESTDLSTQKVLCVMIRFFSIKEKQVVSTFYRVIQLVNCDAISVYNAIKTQLEEDGLNYQNMVGIGADGASVMVGKHNSVTALFKRDLGDLIVVKCVCHSLHLCAEKAAEELPRQLEFLVRETHNWFSYSTKRLEQYRDLYETINEGNRNPNKIQGLSGTRWLARYAAIDTILKQWDELQLLFSLAKTQDKCFMAEQLHDIMRRPAFKAYLVFLRDELKHVTQINMLFQSEHCEPTKLLEDLFLLYKKILQKLVVPSQLQKIHDSELAEFNFQLYLMHTASLNLGYDFEEVAKNLVENELLDVKERCKKFLCTLAMEMQQRLPENLSTLKMITVLKPEVATSQVKPSLNNILQRFHRNSVYGNKNDIEAEWNQLQNKLWTNTSGSSAEFYAEVYNDCDAGNRKRFENISKFAMALLTLPVSNASVERAFSTYAIIKNKLRNRLSLKMCQNIMMVRFSLQRDYKSCVNFSPTSDMIKNFNVRMYEYNKKSSHEEDDLDDDTVLEIMNNIVC
ncbi:protein FAM200B-like [Cydia strobilella]|uniref:protein FAM200B-like n=1 Tax=Cydia strobilella TaxID=1100964 RepID=UPI003004E3DA